MGIGRIQDEQDLTRFVQGLVGAPSGIPVVSAIPSRARHGDQIRYKHDQGRWTFEYDASDGYWYFLGGAALLSTFDASVRTTTSASGASLSSTATIQVPLAGDYEMSIHGEIFVSAAPFALGLWLRDNTNGVAMPEVYDGHFTANVGMLHDNPNKQVTGCVAGGTFAPYGRILGGTGAQTLTAIRIQSKATPIRVQA
ncbi:MAG: hypothetical protein C4558_02460 [Dehalococcoidia bacterium]|nr:MAG: hypothetical protein C4558_02460 [Dehalococcoidia bacterium]